MRTGNEVVDLEACQDYLDVVLPGTPASIKLCEVFEQQCEYYASAKVLA